MQVSDGEHLTHVLMKRVVGSETERERERERKGEEREVLGREAKRECFLNALWSAIIFSSFLHSTSPNGPVCCVVDSMQMEHVVD